jgi:hypothetical protein
MARDRGKTGVGPAANAAAPYLTGTVRVTGGSNRRASPIAVKARLLPRHSAGRHHRVSVPPPTRRESAAHMIGERYECPLMPLSARFLAGDFESARSSEMSALRCQIELDHPVDRNRVKSRVDGVIGCWAAAWG